MVPLEKGLKQDPVYPAKSWIVYPQPLKNDTELETKIKSFPHPALWV